jgi:hypothetical protein
VTIDPPGIECRDRCVELYSMGTRVSLTPTPNADYEFSGWSGSPGCDNAIMLDDDTTCIAMFSHIAVRELRVLVEGNGRVTSVPAGINCSGNCEEYFRQGAVIALSATPDAGWAFAGWAGDAACSDGQVTLEVDRLCVARFVRLPELTGQWTNVGSWCTPPFWRPQICLVFGTFHLINRSSVEVANTTIRFLLSADGVADNGDALLGVRRLRAPGGPRQVGFATILPLGLRPEGRRVIAVVDPDNEVVEADETNNVIAAAQF